MKKISLIIIFAAIFSQGFTQKNKKLNLETKADSVSYALGIDIGNALKRQGVTELNSDLIKSGFDAVIKGNGMVFEEQQNNDLLRDFFGAKQEAAMEKQKKENEDKFKDNITNGKKFLEENSKKQGVITTASGLQYKVITEGTGAKPGPESNVTTHYKGMLIDGTVFDSSYERKEPVSFPVGGVIPGWTEALQLMKVGSKWELYIPQELGYAERDMGVIKPFSTLIFEIELISVEEK